MNRKAFENLRYAHVCTLLDIAHTVRLDRSSHIRRLFAESAEGFDEVVLFLSRLGVIASDGQMLRLRVDWAKSDADFRRDEIMRRLLGKRNRYRVEVYRFVSQFRVVEGEMIYLPSDQSRSSESGVRNFLMDVDVVMHVIGAEKYILMPEYASLLASARDNANYTSPTLLEQDAGDRNAIGCAAEELIIEHERVRVGPSYADKVDHVSIRNCAAGYDIRSVSIEPDGHVIPRFIEVKAVSPITFQFYWSRNEVGVARALSHWYYLYLLPVNRHREFDLNGLMVIPDPHNNVLPERSDWVIESDALICHIKASATH